MYDSPPPPAPSPGRFVEAFANGLSVFPIKPKGKSPLASWKRYQSERASQHEVQQWENSENNAAIATGDVSGVIVLDLDSAEAELGAGEMGWLTDTAIVQTAHGKHYYYKNPNFVVRNGAGILPHVDIRANGGYVVAPGSVHPEGHVYRWLTPYSELAEAPAALLDALKRKRPERNSSQAPRNGAGEFEQILHDLANAPEGQRNDIFNRSAFRAGQLVAADRIDADEAEERLAKAARDAGLDDREIDHVLPRAIDEGIATPRNNDGAEQISQVVMANIYVQRHGNARRYDFTSGRWLAFNHKNGIWERDETRFVFNETANLVHEVGEGAPRYSSVNFISGVETLARSNPLVATTQDHFDTHDMTLGTTDGPVCLRTGKLLPPDPALLISKMTSVAPAPGLPVAFLAFLMQSVAQDQAMVDYLQRALGYTLTGSIEEHALFFVHGDGGNGKGVFMNVVTRIMGEYAAMSAMETFTASKHDKHSTDLAMLNGARLVTASETEKGRQWAEARMKQLTGGDKITARFMRQDNFSFNPKFKLMIFGNHAPVLNTVDDAMRRRFNIIPFTQKPKNPDPKLEEKLEQEFPQILQWMIDGCLLWQRDGLNPPEAVLQATADYFDDQDVFGRWLEEYCEVEAGHKAATRDLFHSWEAYAADVKEEVGSEKNFTATLAKRGFAPGREPSGNRLRFWKGLRLQLVTNPATGEQVAKNPRDYSVRAF